jgi:predicted DsbA family dithiol-disulfide isomerase
MIKSSLDKLSAAQEIEVTWKSFELRPLNAPSMAPAQEKAYQERIAAAWPQTQKTAREAFGVEMISHRWGIKTRLAHEGAKFAEARGAGEAYHEAMFKAHFIEDLDIGDLQTLADIAAELGLDRAEFVQALEMGAYVAEVEQDVAQARAYNLSGVPASIIENKYLISGGQPLESLQDIIRQIKEKEGLSD